MFGWSLRRDREVELEILLVRAEKRSIEEELVKLKDYVAMCDRLIEGERLRVQQERERADRLNDAILQQNGLPNVTSTGLNEEAQRQEEAEARRDKQREELIEISADSLGNMYDAFGLELPPEIAEQAKELIGK